MAYLNTTLAQIRILLAEKWENVPFWTTPEADFAINEALRVWNMLTAQWKRRVVFTVDSADPVIPWIQLPSTITFDLRVQWNDLPLGLTSLFDLDNGRPGWEGEINTMGGDVPDHPTLYAPVSSNIIAIWPTDVIVGNAIVVDGVRDTPKLTLPTDFVDIGEEELHEIGRAHV